MSFFRLRRDLGLSHSRIALPLCPSVSLSPLGGGGGGGQGGGGRGGGSGGGVGGGGRGGGALRYSIAAHCQIATQTKGPFAIVGRLQGVQNIKHV